MNAADEYLRELEAALHLRGRARRRLIAECREHLADSAAVLGPVEAVRRFGPAADVAGPFEAEIALRRTLRATAASVVGVLGIAASVVVMLNAADSATSAPVAWALVFFAAAQVSGVSAALALLRAAVARAEEVVPGRLALLCRRGAVAIGAAFVTMLASGAAVTGHAPAWEVLAGPVLAAIAGALLIHAGLLVRALEPHAPRATCPPLDDIVALIDRLWTYPRSLRGPVVALGVPITGAVAAAFAWNLMDHGTLTGSFLVAATEAVMIAAGFMMLGGALGIRHGIRRAPGVDGPWLSRHS